MRITIIIYAFLLGIINRIILCKIPVFSIYNKVNNITLIIFSEIILFIILEIILYRKTTLKESIIASLIRIGSYVLAILIDYFIIYPSFKDIFDNTIYTLLHMLSTKILFFLISTSSLIGIIISANKEDKWTKTCIKKSKRLIRRFFFFI